MCEEKDERLLREKKKANNKLRYAIKVEKELRNVRIGLFLGLCL